MAPVIWPLRPLYSAELSRFRDELETSLRRAVGAELAEIRRRVQAALGDAREELVSLARYAASNLQASASESRVALLCSIEDLPGEVPAKVDLWRGLRDFFLSKSGELRSRLTVKNGFPPRSGPYKQRCEELLSSLRESGQAERTPGGSALRPLRYFAAGHLQRGAMGMRAFAVGCFARWPQPS